MLLDGAVVMVLKSIPAVKAVVPTKMKHATKRTFVKLSKIHTPASNPPIWTDSKKEQEMVFCLGITRTFFVFDTI